MGTPDPIRRFVEATNTGDTQAFLDTFTEEARRWLVEAERAVDTGDIVILRRVGHSLKSACGAIGAERMRDLAIRLERAAISVSMDEAAAIVRALVDEGAAVIERLRHYLTRGQTSCS